MTTRTIDLNGTWQVRKTARTTVQPSNVPDWRYVAVPAALESVTGRAMKARVPGSIHADLHANKVIADPFVDRNEHATEWVDHQDWLYTRTFAVDNALLAMTTVELVAEGLDTVATISVNGITIARTENMFMEYRFDIRKALRRGSNEISVLFETPYAYIAQRKSKHPYDDGASFGGSIIRKQHSSFCWDWAPSLPGCGIHRAVRIEARDAGRVEWVRIDQRHSKECVELAFSPERAGVSATRAQWHYTVTGPDGRVECRSKEPSVTIRRPRLWWPNGAGDQSLYTVTVELIEHGQTVDVWTRRIGLRTIELDRHADRWGESFQFVVNGRPIYAKGANWVPPHSFAGLVDRERYRTLVQGARDANMNMLRVWGGGLYEQNSFYELCDELGIMIWHDFMFSCTLYPAYREFVEQITAEARFQTRRLAHHASMALWCGNNELELMPQQIRKTALRRRNYDRVFHGILPKAVAGNAPQTAYWPASPHNPLGRDKGPNSQTHGDGHTYFDAWDNPWRNPAATNETYRFCSEFGMQSMSSVQTLETAVSPGNRNVFSPAVENHEKLPGMLLNLVKAVGQRLRMPSDLAGWSYATQINQAYWVGRAIAHQRASMPRTMGSLFWQLNDTWPAISWSSVEFGGRWKALQWTARRLYAPVFMTGSAGYDDTVTTHARTTRAPATVTLSAGNDSAEPVRGTLTWAVYHIDGRRLTGASTKVTIGANSVTTHTFDIRRVCAGYLREELVVRGSVVRGATTLAETTVMLHEPRWMNLSRTLPRASLKMASDTTAELTLVSPSFQHMVAFEFGALQYTADDNYFDLFPGQKRTVTVRFTTPQSLTRLRTLLTLRTCALIC